jgi:endonuclease/exonuclease/phosphatase family metal-dependent hydrolase
VRLVVSTWNCFGSAQHVASVLRWRGVPSAHRLVHPDVLQALHSTDVLCLQEVFLSDAEDFFDGLNHHYKHRDTNHTVWQPFSICGSGLGVASRVPIVAREILPFAPPHVSSERFARKGCLYVQLLQQGGDVVDVFNAHLQSGYDDASKHVRARQLRAMRNYIDQMSSPERLCVVAGDFNVDGLRRDTFSREYQSLRALLFDFEETLPSDVATYCPQRNQLAWRYEPHAPEQRLDYVFVRFPMSKNWKVVASDIFLEHPLQGTEPTHASDHFAVRVVLEHIDNAMGTLNTPNAT